MADWCRASAATSQIRSGDVVSPFSRDALGAEQAHHFERRIQIDLALQVVFIASRRLPRYHEDVRNVALVALLSLFAAAVASTARAGDVLGPADYLKITIDSKLTYRMGFEPSKSPAKMPECPRRDASTRVVHDGTTTKLVAWTVNADAQKFIAEAEPLYQAKKYAEAGAKYHAAIAADPQAVIGHLSYGDTLLFGANDAEGALAAYRRGIALDPTLPLGHYFAQTALVHLGRGDEAREELIEAVALHPAYLETIESADPARWNMRRILRHPFDPPEGMIGGDAKKGIDVRMNKDGRWLGYAVCKAAWANEPRFAKQHVADGWSVAEESACIANELMATYNSTLSHLEEAQKKSASLRPIPEVEVIAAMPTLEHHLYDVAKAGLLEGYILTEIIGRHCPLGLSTLDAKSMKSVRDYIRTYLIAASK